MLGEVTRHMLPPLHVYKQALTLTLIPFMNLSSPRKFLSILKIMAP